MCVNKNTLAAATVAETFDTGFCIYDLSQFLATWNLFKDPDLIFDENSVDIVEAPMRLRYTYAKPATVVSPSQDTFTKLEALRSDNDIQFSITADDLSKLSKASGIMSLDDLVVQRASTSTDDKVSVSVADVRNATSNRFNIDVSATMVPDADFKLVLSIEHLKLIPDNYDVCISEKGVAHFAGTRVSSYYVAVDKAKSEFKVSDSSSND